MREFSSQIRPEQQTTPPMEEKAGENEPTCSSQEAGDGNRASEDDCNRSPDFLSSISCHINKFSRASFEVGEVVKFVHSKLRLHESTTPISLTRSTETE